MAGDKKGKGKMVVQKKKKRTREDREREQAEAVADAADRQGSSDSGGATAAVTSLRTYSDSSDHT